MWQEEHLRLVDLRIHVKEDSPQQVSSSRSHNGCRVKNSWEEKDSQLGLTALLALSCLHPNGLFLFRSSAFAKLP